MFKRKKKNRIELKVNITNCNELDKLLETIQKDIAVLKEDFDRLNQFKITFDLERPKKHN
ncbi:hypothetical protein [Staphylococcus borealis]|uniref:hypothetical protein n=1 Tax=Staphylococcus borealis TaxID=2742203 RepID=UPI002DBBD009|nr:hypothetical protein [Staphylococcus borealis]MEB7460933.1 hypothetical protein [Staphylococcus borealis]